MTSLMTLQHLFTFYNRKSNKKRAGRASTNLKEGVENVGHERHEGVVDVRRGTKSHIGNYEVACNTEKS